MSRSQELFKNLDGRYVELIISCLSDSIEAALMYHEEGSEARVLSRVSRSIQANLKVPNREQIIDTTIAILPDVCAEVARESASLYEINELFKDDQAIHQVSFYLTSPWATKKSYQNSVRFDKDTKVTKLHINNLLQDTIPQGRTRLDSYVANTFANGYETTIDSLLGQSVGDIQVSVIDSYARFDELETLFQIVHSHFNIEEKQVRFLPILSATLHYTQAKYKPQVDYVYIHMHGFNSDIVISRDGLLDYSGSIDFGYFNLARSLVDSGLASSINQAWSLLSMRAHKELHEDTEAGMHAHFQGLSRQMINDMISHVAPDESIEEVFTSLPRDWYIFGDKKLSKYFVEALRDDDHSRRAVVIASEEVHGDASFQHILSQYGAKHDGVDMLQ